MDTGHGAGRENKNMPTVLHVITGLDTGGAETAVFRLIDGAARGPYWHLVALLTPGDAMLPVFLGAGVNVTEIDLRRNPFSGFMCLVRMVREVRPTSCRSGCITPTW